MATVAEKQVELSRQPIWLLKLYLDQCTKENPNIGSGGGSECAATADCYYTYTTCQDKDNYVKGVREYKFTNRGAPYISGALPLMKPIDQWLPTKIRQDRFQVDRGRMKFELQEDDALPLATPDKSGNDYSLIDSGRFLRNMLARNPNYKGRLCELYRGYEGVAEGDFQLYWRGVIFDMDFTRDGIEIESLDLMWKTTDAKAPNKISSDNTVQNNPLTSGATAINVVDGTEFEAASAKEPRCVIIESESIIYTGISGNQLTGCTRGAYGTTAAEHAYDTQIKQCLVYGESDYQTGWPYDRVLLDLLCNRAGIGYEYISVVNRSVSLNGGINDSVATITLTNINNLPGHGIVRIDNELILYTGVSGATITGCLRGMFGSIAAAHNDVTAVYPTSFSDELGNWHQSGLCKMAFTSPKKVTYFIERVQEVSMLDIWQNENGGIQAKMQAPHLGENAETLTEADMIEDSRKVTRNEKNRLTRVIVYYGPSETDPGDDPDDYTYRKIYLDAEAEGVNLYNDKPEKAVYGSACEDGTEALWTASHMFMRNRAACPAIEFETELYHDDIKVGDVRKISVPEVVKADGTRDIRRYRIICKQQKGLNRLYFIAEDTGFGDKRYPLIAPSSINYDYDSATDAEKEKYCWIADSNNLLGADDDEAYRIF